VLVPKVSKSQDLITARGQFAGPETTQFWAMIETPLAIFNVEKLNWFNAQYIRRMTAEAFKSAIGRPELPDAAIPVMTERLERLSDAAQFSYLWEEVEYDGAILNWKDSPVEQTRSALALCRELAQQGSLTGDALDALATEKFDGKKGSVYWPLRVALSGHRNSAGPLDIARVIGPDAVLARIETALSKLA